MHKAPVITKRVDSMQQSHFIEHVRDMEEDGQGHLEIEMFYNFALTPETLDKKTSKFIENHLAVCDRCNSQMKEIIANKDTYSRLLNV